MRDIKRIVLYVEGVFSKLKFKFLDIQQKGDHYAFFIFFKGSIAVLFLVGFFSIFLRDNLGPVTPIHAIVDQEIKVEKVIENSSTKYSEVFASGRLVAGLNIDALMSDSTGIGGSVEYINSVDQGSAFLWNNTSEIEETVPTSDRVGLRKYVVRSGDTPAAIANSFGLSLDTLLWSNDLSSSDYIQPGDELMILPMDGLAYEVQYGDTISTIASRYKADGEEILRVNDIADAAHIVAGQTLIIPGGVKPPVPKYATTRTSSPALENLSGYFIKPTTGYISQWLHGYNAVDIAGGCWQPVYAAASGSAVLSVGNGRWNGGFGNYVKVSHPNGTSALYAHLIQTSVFQGQDVGQGQLIGYTGSTGRSTGCHLHWEVHGARNPLS